MSTLPRPSASLHPTRQQLDELDELMQRMLALPVEEPDPSPEPCLEGTPSKADCGPLLVEDLVDEEETATARERPLPQRPLREVVEPPLRRLVPAPALLQDHGAREDLLLPSGLPSLQLPPHSPDKSVPPADVNEDPELAKTSGWRGPLLWCNRAFDATTLVLGPLGGWLRGAWGRSVLGWLGLVLLAATVVWGVLDWMGWTR